VTKKSKVVIAGLGEVGKPLFELVSKHHDAVGVDISPIDRPGQVDVLHVCYPFAIKDFVGETVRYIEYFRPALTIVNSTVAVGTTRSIAKRAGVAVVNSPVRGKHARMLEELLIYRKFVGAIDPAMGELAARHFESLGMKTKILSSPEATELAKLTETTYFGVLIAWAQEVERYCDQSGQDYGEISSFWEEIKYLPPVKFFPGIIGGHCVMPNIKILSEFDRTVIIEAIQESNNLKIERESSNEVADGVGATMSGVKGSI
jgi:UDP-N-acetyl-D-mannosaminuronate dehydrogenase